MSEFVWLGSTLLICGGIIWLGVRSERKRSSNVAAAPPSPPAPGKEARQAQEFVEAGILRPPSPGAPTASPRVAVRSSYHEQRAARLRARAQAEETRRKRLLEDDDDDVAGAVSTGILLSELLNGPSGGNDGVPDTGFHGEGGRSGGAGAQGSWEDPSPATSSDSDSPQDTFASQPANEQPDSTSGSWASDSTNDTGGTFDSQPDNEQPDSSSGDF